jgi:mRNA interferase HigB
LAGRDKLNAFGKKHAQARSPISAWTAEIERAEWKTTADLKARYPKASILADNIVIFDLGGNKFRLESRVLFQVQLVVVSRIATHEEYRKWRR